MHWIDEANGSTVQQEYIMFMQALQKALNRALYFGLYEIKSRFATYPIAAVSRKHSDQFKAIKNARSAAYVISTKTGNYKTVAQTE